MGKTKFSGRIDSLALSLSGGGVRAVGFHLGTMSMLQRLELLEKVEILSSVSGGSMPGIGYALSQAVGRSFQDFFDDFYAFLPQLNVVEEMMKRMVGREPSSPSGRRDMITSMANIYDYFYFNKFFSDYAEGGSLKFGLLMKKPRKGHLKEIVFNATEFKTGTAFRFQVSEYRCLIGNRNIALCHKHAAMIRIADIMAASSCIPVGMEPMFFPDDFRWPDDSNWSRRTGARNRPTCREISRALEKNLDTQLPNFALMDGGVYDNQGISSTLNALNRRIEGIKEAESPECGWALTGRGDPPGPKEWANWMSGRVVPGAEHRTVDVNASGLDLLIVSDTPVRKASLFPRVSFSRDGTVDMPQTSKKKAGLANKWFGKITIGQVNIGTWIVLLLLAGSSILTVFDLIPSSWIPSVIKEYWTFGEAEIGRTGGWIVLHLVIPLIVSAMAATGLILLKLNKEDMIEKLHHAVPNWKGKPGKYISKLRVGDLLEMGVLRGGSVSVLTSSIYMNRIRALGYAAAFSREDLRNRVIDNEIFTLQIETDADDPFHVMLATRQAWPPAPEMTRIIGKAATMPTKLWLEQEKGDPLNDLDYLVAGGQATVCYNLMRYMWEECRTGDEWMQPETGELFERALTEWKKLSENPLSLLQDRKRNSRLPELNAQAELM
jgi:hypothetical protein